MQEAWALSTRPVPKAVYIDTMVFVYHLLSSCKSINLVNKARRFFEDVENGKYIGIATTFTIAEYLAVIKGVLCERRNGQVTAIEMANIKSQFEQFLNQMGIILYDSDDLAGKTPVFSDCESIVENSGSYKGKRDHKWHYLRGADALHIAFALSVKAEAFVTFDDDFRGSNISVNPIMLSEAY